MRSLPLTGAACVLALVVYLPLAEQRAAPAPLRWRPALVTSWQWQLTGTLDTSIDAAMYDVDLFETPASTVRALRAAGRKVVCYISAGSWEDWRPDKDAFPSSVIGRSYDGWPGERWLDIRRITLLAPIMRARLDQCRDKGFDAVEPDNIDGYLNDTGFPLSAEDQLRYNRWFADEAHVRGLSVGLKNNPEQVEALVAHFDWALTESCVAEGWCEQMRPFLQARKPVFATEYTDTGMTIDRLCAAASRLQINAILKHRSLDAYREVCPAAAPSVLLRDFALPTPLFDIASAWNQRAAEVTVLPESSEQVLHLYRVLLGDRATLVPAGSGLTSAYPFPFVSFEEWTVPIARAGGSEQRVQMRDYAGEPTSAHPKLPAAADGTVGVPTLAGQARPSAPEGTDSDGHLVLFQPDTQREFDFWHTTTARDAQGRSLGGGQVGTVIFAAGAMDTFSVRGGGANAPTVSSARASGVPLLAGLLVPEDLERGVIDHALIFSIPGPRNTNTANPDEPRPSDYVYPASTTEVNFYSTSRNALASGQRIRLRREIVDEDNRVIDEATLRPITRRFLAALRTYGAYLVDNAGGFVFPAEDFHTADLRLTESEVNTLIGRPAGTSLPADKTRWQLVMEALNEDLERIPLASGPWQEFGPGRRDPATAMFILSNFDVIEPARAPAGAARR